MNEQLTPRKVLEEEFNEYVNNWTWTPDKPKWEDVSKEHNDLGYVMNAIVRWARICVNRERENDPWLPVSEAPMPAFNQPKVVVIRWHIKQDEPITVWWSGLDKIWYTTGKARHIPEQDMLPVFMYMPKKPKI